MSKNKKKTKLPAKKAATPEVLPALKKANKKPASKSSKELVSYDPLVAYLREIRDLQKLSPDEEKDLAIKYVENKDLKIAYQLVSSNLWLVVKIAREYEKLAKSLLDLIQEGNMGLMEAVKNYDPHRGVRLPTYAVWWIKAYIIRYILANWRLVKIGTTQAQKKLFFNLNKEKEKLEREGFKPTPKLLAERLDVKESEVIEMQQRLAAPDLSVDAPYGDEEDSSTLHSVLPADQPTSEDLVSEKEFQALIQSAFDEFKGTLKEKHLVIFERRLLGEEKVTLQELANSLDISVERVRQLESQIKTKLKEFLLENYNAQIEDENF